MIWARMRSTGSGSKRGSVSASFNSRAASSRLAESVRSEPSKTSRPASKLMPIDRSSRRAWNAWLSRSPAPSSSRPESMLATPGLSAGSCAAPPSKAKDMEISGIDWSSTSQAVMPRGLTTFWMSMASAAALHTMAANARPATAAVRATDVAMGHHERPSAGSGSR